VKIKIEEIKFKTVMLQVLIENKINFEIGEDKKIVIDASVCWLSIIFKEYEEKIYYR
jgi:hypothetical protein